MNLYRILEEDGDTRMGGGRVGRREVGELGVGREVGRRARCWEGGREGS